jgi:protein gp37
VFCASLSDWLDNEVPTQWLIDLLDLIRLTPNLDWQLLTKRVGNWERRLEQVLAVMLMGSRSDLYRWVWDWRYGDIAPANVWLGATVVNQAEADRDIPKLLQVPARIRFLSVEPMLGRVDLCEIFGMWWNQTMKCFESTGMEINRHYQGRGIAGRKLIDWVICGGESGPKARPMHPDWVRSLRDQCAAAGVPFLFKQWGGWTEHMPPHAEDADILSLSGKYDFIDGVHMTKLGKKNTGNLLDGRQHLEFPTAPKAQQGNGSIGPDQFVAKNRQLLREIVEMVIAALSAPAPVREDTYKADNHDYDEFANWYTHEAPDEDLMSMRDMAYTAWQHARLAPASAPVAEPAVLTMEERAALQDTLQLLQELVRNTPHESLARAWGCMEATIKALLSRTDLPDLPDPKSATSTVQEPVATIHSDGYWTHEAGKDPFDRHGPNKNAASLKVYVASLTRTEPAPKGDE